MATRLTDVASGSQEEARPIGRARPASDEPVNLPAGLGFGLTQGAPVHVPVPEAPTLLTMAEVEDIVAQRVAQAVKKATEEATDKAYKEGFGSGAKSVQSAQDQWLDKLRAGIQQSLEQLEHKLARTEQLSLEVARVTLDRVLGCDEARPELLRQIVRHQMAALTDATVLRVRLSERDLREHPDLAQTLQAELGDRVQVAPDAQLAAGGCVFELRLGQVDAGIDTHRDLIRAHFARAQDPHDVA